MAQLYASHERLSMRYVWGGIHSTYSEAATPDGQPLDVLDLLAARKLEEKVCFVVCF